MIHHYNKHFFFYKLIIFQFFCVQISCQHLENKSLTIVNDLSPLLEEVSGITYDPNSKLIFAVNDSGNDNSIFQLDTEGEIVNQLVIEGVYNKDWEAVAVDKNGTLYIGDFGNNKNARKDLTIYKVLNPLSPEPSVQIIKFILSDQNDFPPKKKKRNFDIESFIIADNSIYLFSRNRSSEFNGETKIYQLKNVPGTQSAQLEASLFIGNDDKDCFITDAAISAKGDQIALLTYNKVILLDSFQTRNFWKGNFTKIKLEHRSQKEGITFLNDSTLLITDEKKKDGGNYLYKFDLK